MIVPLREEDYKLNHGLPIYQIPTVITNGVNNLRKVSEMINTEERNDIDSVSSFRTFNIEYLQGKEIISVTFSGNHGCKYKLLFRESLGNLINYNREKKEGVITMMRYDRHAIFSRWLIYIAEDMDSAMGFSGELIGRCNIFKLFFTEGIMNQVDEKMFDPDFVLDTRYNNQEFGFVFFDKMMSKVKLVMKSITT